MTSKQLLTVVFVSLTLAFGGEQQANAQRRGLQIGGPNGLIIGGGNGFRAGGPRGVQFGGGEGARFGPRGTGVQFGGGVGARFGPDVQFGGRKGYAYPATSLGPTTYPGVVPAGPSGPTAGYGNSVPQLTPPTPVRSLNQSVISKDPEMVVLKYPESAKRSLNYTINGTPFQLAPGNTIQMQSGLNWEIGIAGKNGQPNSFKLQEAGLYLLKQTDSGWVIDESKCCARPRTRIHCRRQRSSQTIRLLIRLLQPKGRTSRRQQKR